LGGVVGVATTGLLVLVGKPATTGFLVKGVMFVLGIVNRTGTNGFALAFARTGLVVEGTAGLTVAFDTTTGLGAGLLAATCLLLVVAGGVCKARWVTAGGTPPDFVVGLIFRTAGLATTAVVVEFGTMVGFPVAAFDTVATATATAAGGLLVAVLGTEAAATTPAALVDVLVVATLLLFDVVPITAGLDAVVADTTAVGLGLGPVVVVLAAGDLAVLVP